MSTAVTACGIYARISSDDGSALGVARQIEDCTREAERRGWPVAQVFTDNDVSATKSKPRPEYERLLVAIEARTIDALVVYDVDRLTRTPAELERFIDLADRHHAALASVGGDVDLATPQGRLTARIKGSVARHEVEQMSRRLKRKFQESAKDGQAHGVTPFGYRRERTKDDQGRDSGYREVIEPAEADAVRELYRMVIAGESLRGLAKYLNDRGFKTGRGNEFRGNVVGNMLRRQRYAGHRTHAGQIVSKGQWEPIVSQDTWDQVAAILAAPGRRHSRGLEPKHLLSGIALCGRCGTAMRPSISTRRKPSYVCPGCMRLTRQMDPVHEVVNAVMIGRLSRPDVLAATAPKPDMLRAALAARDAVLARMDAAADMSAAGITTPRQFARMNEQLKTQLDAAEHEVKASQPVRVLDGMTGPDSAASWAAASIDRKREIIRTLATVTILPSGPGIPFSPEQVEISWKTD
ncbi:recombinase family protein [Arthrobacter sp. FW306-2-2C-D06B]|uniref:recombinase family protein n=1 Tax=Arthrobacter sp. FW306-2-2C-D06B TaxID=2879618 RepID=UPI001F311689|nr:recombinase family protein [Arthrobacter sp. FW306-2-2C-D06B]UKA57519.1 recombinase family protein [Arthrobacter sp. FW306-2-2C-D06B]